MKKIIFTLAILIASISASTEKERDNGYKLIGLIAQGKTQEAIVLINEGVDFYAFNYNQYGQRRPMRVAALHDNLDIIKALLKAGDTFDQEEGQPGALEEAMWNHNYELTEFLVSKGANPLRIFYTDKSSVTLAVRDNLSQYIYMFVNYMSSKQKLQLYRYALNTNNDRILSYLASNIPLTANYTDKDGKLLKKLVFIPAFKVNYQDKKGRTAFMDTIEKENMKYISLLLQKGADLDLKDKKGVSARDMINETNNKALYLLIKNIASKQELDLINAAKEGNIKKVKEFLKHNLNLEATDVHGSTALIQASASNHPKVVSLLLQNEAQCNKKTSYGFTPLMIAGNSGSIDSARVLLEHKCYVNEKGKAEFRQHSTWTKNKFPEYFKFFEAYKTEHGL